MNTRPWGAARKAINLFLREAYNNRYLNKEFELDVVENWLEIPLDSVVAKGLKKKGLRGQLPLWTGLKHLKPEISDIYQDFASVIAQEKGIARVHLDMYLWLENR